MPVDGIPFDDRRGVIPNEAGRVVDRDRGGHMPGQYAVGWIKRGPSGVIGTNKKDAQDTVDSLFEDLEAGRMPEPADPGRDSIHALVTERRPDHVTYQGWQAIDTRRGRARQAAGPTASQVLQDRRDGGGRLARGGRS